MSMHGSQGLQLALTAHYALSPVGLDAETTCAALRARISRQCENDLYLPMPPGPEALEDLPLVAACVPELALEIQGVDRLLSLGLGAFRGLIERAALARSELQHTGLLVALPAPDAATRSWALDRMFLPWLLARAGLHDLAPEHLAVATGGNTAVFALLGKAATWLDAGEVRQCILLAVDSYIDLERLHTLDLEYRLKSERGVDGFVPGEAAVALLVERNLRHASTQRPALARLTLPAMADEPRPQSGDKSSTGTGLTAALRGALRSLPAGDPPTWILCDMNGESYRAFEWGVARARLGPQLGDPLVIQHPADCIGDTGAACAGLLIASATQAYQRGYANGQAALLWTASFARARGAMLVLPATEAS